MIDSTEIDETGVVQRGENKAPQILINRQGQHNFIKKSIHYRSKKVIINT